MVSHTCRVFGTPAPQGSKRHVGGGRLIESSQKVGPWREAVVSACHRDNLTDLRIDAPVQVDVEFLLHRPASHHGANGIKKSAPAWPAVVPDLDKLLRSTLDGLTAAGVFVDDSRVVHVIALKKYADGTTPGAFITVTTLTTTEGISNV